jgi:transcriptional regulator with GAF, ATPase, and Fis domain
MTQPTVVLWDADPTFHAACEIAAGEWGTAVAAVSGGLAAPSAAAEVRAVVAAGCSPATLRDRLESARKLFPCALAVGVLPHADHEACARVADLERIAVAEETSSRAALAAAILEAASVPPASWPRGVIGISLAASLLRARIATAAACDASVLLCGETGTGKSAAARAIHELSARAAAPFVHVDCAALAPSVFESEIFGHERGAFTGALARRPGRFEIAGKGTILLDEIGEIPEALQSKFLRVLEERSFDPVGSSVPQPMRARVVAATRIELPRAVAEGRFRSDLYFRLRVYPVEIPSLRERRADIPALAAHAIPRLCERLGRPMPSLEPSFSRRLFEHAWPGNVRELLHALEAVLVRRSHGALCAASVERVLEPLGGASAAEANEDERLRGAFAATGGNVALVARLLGVPRSTARYRIQRLGLHGAAEK